VIRIMISLVLENLPHRKANAATPRAGRGSIGRWDHAGASTTLRAHAAPAGIRVASVA
jgi:hypothetical protein